MSIYVYDKDYIKTKGDAVAVWIGALLPIIALVAFLIWFCW
jgi:hypothetical protein